jgi:hypothetical protein
MKDKLRSGSQAEMGGAGKSGKAHFSARLIFLPSFCLRVAVSRSDKIIKGAGCPRPFFAPAFLLHSLWLKNQGQSKPVKVNQSDSVGQAGGPNRM